MAFPGEHSWIELDNVSGVDCLTVLFAKRELDLDALWARFEREDGDFPRRVARLAFSALMPNNRAVCQKAFPKFWFLERQPGKLLKNGRKACFSSIA
jgi:hypothetical protein